jgi:hypothetical protein
MARILGHVAGIGYALLADLTIQRGLSGQAERPRNFGRKFVEAAIGDPVPSFTVRLA